MPLKIQDYRAVQTRVANVVDGAVDCLVAQQEVWRRRVSRIVGEDYCHPLPDRGLCLCVLPCLEICTLIAQEQAPKLRPMVLIVNIAVLIVNVW